MVGPKYQLCFSPGLCSVYKAHRGCSARDLCFRLSQLWWLHRTAGVGNSRETASAQTCCRGHWLCPAGLWKRRRANVLRSASTSRPPVFPHSAMQPEEKQPSVHCEETSVSGRGGWRDGSVGKGACCQDSRSSVPGTHKAAGELAPVCQLSTDLHKPIVVQAQNKQNGS